MSIKSNSEQLRRDKNQEKEIERKLKQRQEIDIVRFALSTSTKKRYVSRVLKLFSVVVTQKCLMDYGAVSTSTCVKTSVLYWMIFRVPCTHTRERTAHYEGNPTITYPFHFRLINEYQCLLDRQ